MIDELTRQLRIDEGVRSRAYRDSLGLLTIGVGRLIDPTRPGCGLRDSEIDMLLANDIADRVATLTKALPWFTELDEARRGVLLNMAFQLGTAGLLAFTTTLSHVRVGRFDEAARAMLASKWATQAPNRAARMAEQMRTGEWQYGG